MSDLGSSDSAAFVFEGEIEPIVNGIIDNALKDQDYNEKMVNFWINSICENTIHALADLAKPFKYIVNCSIMQNTGAGMHCVTSEYFDCVNDGCGVVRWPNEKARETSTILCVVTIFGLAL